MMEFVDADADADTDADVEECIRLANPKIRVSEEDIGGILILRIFFSFNLNLTCEAHILRHLMVTIQSLLELLRDTEAMN